MSDKRFKQIVKQHKEHGQLVWIGWEEHRVMRRAAGGLIREVRRLKRLLINNGVSPYET